MRLIIAHPGAQANAAPEWLWIRLEPACQIVNWHED